MLVYVNLYSLTLIHSDTNKAVNEESLFEQFPLPACSDGWIDMTWIKKNNNKLRLS